MASETVVYDFGEIHDDWITCIAVSPNSKTFFTGSKDSTMRFWSVSMRECLKDFGLIHQGSLSAMIMTSDGYMLYTADNKGYLKMWDINDHTEYDFGKVHENAITCLAITP